MKKVLILLLISLYIASCTDNEEDLNKDISVPVTVSEVKLRSIEKYINTTGTVYPLKEVSLKSEISGKYRLLKNPNTGKPFALGDKIVEGTTIILLENKEFENNLKINSLELRLEISQQTYDKQKSLYDKGGVTLSELKNAEIEYVNSKYAYQDAIIGMKKLSIKAPFSGVIVELPYYTYNTKVEANSSMMKMMDYSQLQMEVKLAEKNFTMLKKNQKVRIMNYTVADDTLQGTISQISPAIDPETRSFSAIISINNSEMKLHPGMFAKGEIVVSSVDSTIVIPKDIILSKQRGNTVFVVNKGLAEERIVTFGIENPDEVQITSGLDKNDRVVIKGFETLRNRSKIKELK
ncbi:MAG: efflux RND transporter periplasmic adaptor subunit [Bacteroidales bacterium]|nr:efflux RND transporter periplasmic adaptor subunit [Bacteroidales bacterium]